MSANAARVTEVFANRDVVYCSRLAPVKHWKNGRAQFCYLPLGHPGDHTYAEKWVEEPAQRKSRKTLVTAGVSVEEDTDPGREEAG